jgi:uracil phosphoribosyltransferase
MVCKATGGSAIKAVEVLMEHGVPEERMIFVNLVSITLVFLSRPSEPP